MRHRYALGPALAVAACAGSDGGGASIERAGAPFTEVVLETAPGLSGLARDDTGALWAVAERDERIYRITLDGTEPTLRTFVVTGVPEPMDLEGIAVLGPGKLALGTEGVHDGVAHVLLAEVRGDTVAVTGRIDLPDASVGLRLESNHGAEGVGGVGDTIVVAIETVSVEDGRRWAPIVVIENGVVVRAHRLWLTTSTGGLSGIDCRLREDDGLEVLAIERHFEVTKLLTFTLPESGDITPREVLDLGPVLGGRLNLEGVTWSTDGGVIAVIDNQWKTITGPSELLLFEPGALR